MSATAKVGAFFDLDGTVVAPPSLEWRFVTFLLARDELATRDITRWLIHFAKRIAFDPHGAVLANKQYHCGLRASLGVDWERSLPERSPPLYAPALERLTWHWTQGHRVFVVSGTLDFLAHAVAQRLPGPVQVSATQLEVRDGCWTGRLASAHLSGKEKARTVRLLATQFGLSLWESYAYGNSTSDLVMLDSVGHHFAVNPRAALRRIASSEVWPVCDWRTLDAAQPISSAQLAARKAHELAR